MISFLAAAALGAPLQAGAQTPTLTSQPERSDVADGEEGAPSGGWRAATGLRVEQWIAPTDDHLRFNVRVTLPQVAFGEHVAFSAFAWERLDVAEGKKSNRGENGTVYQLLGARYRSEHRYYGFFVGAHALTWSGHGRPVTPWLGVRLGKVDGPSITGEARMLGLGPQGGEMSSPLDDTDMSVAIEGPRLGPVQIAARGRARDVRHPDRHQREQMASLGVEFNWGPKRLFLGVGVQHQMRRANADAQDVMPPTAARMATPAIDSFESTAVMVHLDAESPLPRSILPD